MIFYLIGIDYKTAEIKAREEAILLKKSFIQFLGSDGQRNARLFSTCNRFEIYDFAESENEAFYNLNILKKNFNYFFGNSYAFFGEKEVFKHLVRLACGLESQLKAEGQILEQLINFSSQKKLPENLKKILDRAIYAARAVRAKVGLNNKAYTIADLVLEDVVTKTNNAGPLKVIVIGTGKIAELFAVKPTSGFKFHFLAHKNYLKANELAKRAKGKADSLRKIDEVILDADILISATSSPHCILAAEFFEKVMVKRKKTLCIYDLAIPRDIDPKVSKIDRVILKNMEDLSPLFERYNKAIEGKLLLLENFTQEQINKYEGFIDEANIKAGHAA